MQPHESALRAWLRARYPGLSDVDDVIHESYLNLLRRRACGRITYAKAYLFTAARHAVARLVRKRRIFSDTEFNELPEACLVDEGADVTGRVNGWQEDALMAEAIATLPARCREIIVLRAVHGCSYAEIAEDLGLSQATVRVQIARGVKKCGQFMTEHGANHSA